MQVHQNGVDGETSDVWVDAGGPSQARLGRLSEGVYIGEVDRRMERILLLDYKLTILTWLQCF